MININDVATKLQNILNGIDNEVVEPQPIAQDFTFKVETEGYHLDIIADIPERKNFIPVFIGVMGGEYNPVPTMIDEDLTLPVSIYVPVRFKERMYELNEYIVKAFVGAQLTYGENKAVSNVSVATFSELEQGSLLEFQEWVSDVFHRPIDVDDSYFFMQFNLYLSSVKTKNGSDVMFGNSLVKINLAWEDNNTDLLSTGIITNYQANSSSQQILGQDTTKGVEQTSVITYSFTANLKDNTTSAILLQNAMGGYLQGTIFTLSVINSYDDLSIRNERVYCQSAMVNMNYGEPISIAFVFARRI